MNGAEALVRTLASCGVDICFANPGTSEMHFVAALDKVDGLRPVLVLFEGVATGAADGYARMAGRPAATLLHLGAGLGNGLANLHNARRAGSPVVNIVGDHATDHLRYDAPLTSDIVGIARPVSHWVHRSLDAAQVPHDGARAVREASEAPGRVATLILPADTAWTECGGPIAPLPALAPVEVAAEAIERVARLCGSEKRLAFLLRGRVLQRDGLEAAKRIAAATGARIMCDTFAPRLERGAGVPQIERVPYFAEQMTEFFAGVETLVLVGGRPPVTFFAYPGRQSWCLPPDCDIVHLAHEHEDALTALRTLADRLPAAKAEEGSLARPVRPGGRFNPFTVGLAIGALLPEGAIICDDGATASGAILAGTEAAAPHTHLSLTGGAIGDGLPMAVGAAVACPGRKVVCLTGDGSAMYTPQALWTMAREKLDVTVIVFANRAYKILQIELQRVGAGVAGTLAQSMLDLHNPELDFVALARSMGVEGTRSGTIDEFWDQFGDAVHSSGPRLIEVMI